MALVVVVLWVIYKSWTSALETKGFQVFAVLLLIGGIIKCFQKPWALRSASFQSLANSCGPSQRTACREKELENYVKQARVFILSGDIGQATGTAIYEPGMLFTDLPYPYCDRLTNLKCSFFWYKNSLKDTLSNIFEVLYTRKKMINCEEFSRHCLCGWLTLILCFYTLIMASFHILAHLNGVDGIVTLALVFGTGVLEYLAPKIMDWSEKIKWPDRVLQHNVIGYFSRNRRHAMLMRFARLFQCKDLLDQIWCMEPCYSPMDITKLVHQHVQDGWKEYIHDAESYREFNDIRGQWILVHESCDESLGWSLEKPFDESVLLWHLATDFCFY
uniref:DUF4220 domain-containing protein n=1 Tax=Aegilops tauschii TaxID=37682 RepID=R7VZM8_AEGTA